jgi:hypothetical protein
MYTSADEEAQSDIFGTQLLLKLASDYCVEKVIQRKGNSTHKEIVPLLNFANANRWSGKRNIQFVQVGREGGVVLT